MAITAHPRIRNSQRYPTRTWLESYPRGHHPRGIPPRDPSRAPTHPIPATLAKRTRNKTYLCIRAPARAPHDTPRDTRARNRADAAHRPTASRRCARAKIHPSRRDARRGNRHDCRHIDASNFPSTYPPRHTASRSRRPGRFPPVSMRFDGPRVERTASEERIRDSSSLVGNWMERWFSLSFVAPRTR